MYGVDKGPGNVASTRSGKLRLKPTRERANREQQIPAAASLTRVMLSHFSPGAHREFLLTCCWKPRRIPMSASKIYSVQSLSDLIGALKTQEKRVVFTNGCFDLLHPGHIELFEKASQYGDVLVVAINSDASVRRLKGAERPILTEDERTCMLAALTVVDYVCVFDEDTPLETIEALRPDVLVKGADWMEKGIVGQSEVEGWGGQVVIASLVEGQSTTAIVERIRSLRVS